MKLLIGDPGKPDGWIPPPKVLNLQSAMENDQVSQLFESGQPSYCDLSQTRLYNLTSDPYERINLAKQYPQMVEDLSERLSKYIKTMIAPDVAHEILAGNPNRNGGFFGPGWCQSEPRTSDVQPKLHLLN